MHSSVRSNQNMLVFQGRHEHVFQNLTYVIPTRTFIPKYHTMTQSRVFWNLK